jgi:hypothetical protein
MKNTSIRDAPVPARPRRWALFVVAAIGVALAVMPVAFDMFSKTPQGATMIAEFKPFMTTQRLDGFQTDLKEINAGVKQSNTSVASYLDGGTSDRAAFDRQFPTFVTFNTQWPAIDAKMTHLMDQVQANLGNYQAVAALPSFTLFPWFFVIPGRSDLRLRTGLVAAAPTMGQGSLGPGGARDVGLIAAPGIFQMFQRAPKGGHMMTAFKTIETTNNVEQIQGYFGTMAEGQGAIRLEIVPSLSNAGPPRSRPKREFPAVASLDSHWVHILNDMTPMIGAMSDNVSSYQAIASLPPFPLFPWFFVLPGVMVAGLARGGRLNQRKSLRTQWDGCAGHPVLAYEGAS